MRAMTNPITRVLSLGLLGLALSAPAMAADRDDYNDYIDRLARKSGLDGELALRIIAVGLENNERLIRGEKLSQSDVYCFFGEPTGSKLTHLICRENDNTKLDTGKLRVASSVDTAQGGSGGGADIHARTSRVIMSFPAREPRLLGYIEMLPGLPSMNQRLVAVGLATGSIPQGLPTMAELDRFVEAYREVGAITDRYDPRIQSARGAQRDRLIRESDQAMARAIRDAGLEMQRYNEIVEHVSSQPELFEYVKNRV